ncbi:MAG: NAD(P)H-dependent oxidoreductase [Cyclobacteriaceae bacterium]
MNILSIGASNSSNSINKQFATWTAKQLAGAEVKTIDLNDYEMPIYSMDREKVTGIPEEAVAFKHEIDTADGMIISFAEYNGSYSSAYKNILDWVSRLGGPIWSDKPVLLLATSPGPRGAQMVLSTSATLFPHHGARVAGTFSLPSFSQNFDNGITNEDLKNDLFRQLNSFQELVHSDIGKLAETNHH